MSKRRPIIMLGTAIVVNLVVAIYQAAEGWWPLAILNGGAVVVLVLVLAERMVRG